MEKRIGRQTPTTAMVLPYEKTLGADAVAIYNSTGRTAHEWQALLSNDMMAYREDGTWVHTRCGYSVPRRNGKTEDMIIRVIKGLERGEQILWTAHRTATSHSSWEKICGMLDKLKETDAAKWDYKSYKQLGFESITLTDNDARVNFRTRSSQGGLGEGYDTLLIDEAQEYTQDQATALKYVISASQNPQTIMCGTPPTAVSAGTVFQKFRNDTLSGKNEDCYWAEWSVDQMTDVNDKEAWYECNPSLGLQISERSVRDEIDGDDVDFNIQRLGWWSTFSQASVISKADWESAKVDRLPSLRGKLFVGIKYGKNGANTALSIAVKTNDNIFVESIDCRPQRDGNDWILRFLKRADVQTVIADGNGSATLKDEMKDAKIKTPVILPKVSECVQASQLFEQYLFGGRIRHMGQPSLSEAATNCEHRAIGQNGGFGYTSLKSGIDVSLLDSVFLAMYICAQSKEVKRQRIVY